MTRGAPERGLSHIAPDGSARMVDVGAKEITERFAAAEALVEVSPELAERIRSNSLAKGSVLEVARLAGIMAARRTDELIPLCHTLPLDGVDVEATLEGATVRIRAEVRARARTGVEMEALVAVSVAALTVYDMGKSVDRAITVRSVRVVEKRGGRSGDYRATPAQSPGARP